MENQFVWVDIPVKDLDRAIKFYGAVLGGSISRESGPGFTYALLPHAGTNVSGCLVPADGEYVPSKTGPLVYLNVDGRLDAAIAAVGAQGGSIMREKHSLGPHGWRALVLDTEGNRLALHSNRE